MGITDRADTAQHDAFVARVRNRLADHGALAGLAQGEAFKAIRQL
jgi:hypothetical protein